MFVTGDLSGEKKHKLKLFRESRNYENSYFIWDSHYSEKKDKQLELPQKHSVEVTSQRSLYGGSYTHEKYPKSKMKIWLKDMAHLNDLGYKE